MPNLVGIGNSQVPTNGMLGGLAYQDPSHVSIQNVEIENIAAITSSVNHSITCAFVYDTTQDSDGGLWTNKCTNTSWYTEDLGTYYRGNTRDFPKIAIIVGTSANEVIIYDATRSNTPMWMIFSGNNSLLYEDARCIRAINGCVYVGTNTYGLIRYNFIDDTMGRWRDSGGYNGYKQPDSSIFGRIASVNSASVVTPPFNQGYLKHDDVDFIEVCVLPKAPIDPSTKLPRPTIVVKMHDKSASAGGITVLQDDGASIKEAHHGYASSMKIGIIPEQGALIALHNGATSGQSIDIIDIKQVHRLKQATSMEKAVWGTHDGSNQRNEPQHATNAIGYDYGRYYAYSTSGSFAPGPGPYYFGSGWGSNRPHIQFDAKTNQVIWASSSGIYRIQEHYEHLQRGMVNIIRHSANTGWMHGDCHGAYLCSADGSSGSWNSALADFTHNANTATVSGGNVDYAPVADGADLMYGSGFYDNSAKAQATQTIDFGNSAAITLMCWFKTTTTNAYQYMMSAIGPNGGCGLALSVNDGHLYFWDSTNSNTGHITSDSTTDDLGDNGWHHAVGTLEYGSSATMKSLYIDGRLVLQSTKATVNMSGTTQLNIGHYSPINQDSPTYRWRGQLALVRFSGGATTSGNHKNIHVPTADQVEQIYNDEKKLFQKNAKCSIYGSSSDVVANDFDKTTGKYHAGTSGGRSDFIGLQRVSHSTTAVTTHIAANSGIIVEQ